jgi:hypothetical protein
MGEVLGDRHPQVLFATVNLANVVADLGDPEQALEIERAAATVLREVIGPHHPETLAAASNMAVSLDALSRKEEAQLLRADVVPELQRQLGDDHAYVAIAGDARRFNRDLEPLVV